MLQDMKDAEPEAIARVHVQAWREAYAGIVPQDYLDALKVEDRTRLWTRVAVSEGHYGRVWLEGGRVVGFISGVKAREALGEHEYELAAIYILRDFHKKGIGRKLVDGFLSSIDSRSVYAWVLAQNPSRAFYENLGCVPFAEKVDTIGGKEFKEIAYSFDV